MLFYTGFIFKAVFGSVYQTALKGFLVLLFVLYAYCLWNIVKKDGRQTDIWLMLFLSLLLVYPHFVSDNLEKGLAMIFTFFGYYLLYHSEIRLSWAYAALSFSVAFFSSVKSLIIIAILVGWYPFQSGIIAFSSEKRKGLFIRRKGLVILGGLAVICLAIFGLLKLLYPNILTYILFAHSTDPLYTLSQALKNLVPSASIDKDLFIVYVVMALSAWVFYKNKEVSPLAVGIGLAVIMLMQHKGSGGIIIGRYMAPAFPFIILTLYQLKKMSRKGNY